MAVTVKFPWTLEYWYVLSSSEPSVNVPFIDIYVSIPFFMSMIDSGEAFEPFSLFKIVKFFGSVHSILIPGSLSLPFSLLFEHVISKGIELEKKREYRC